MEKRALKDTLKFIKGGHNPIAIDNGLMKHVVMTKQLKELLKKHVKAVNQALKEELEQLINAADAIVYPKTETTDEQPTTEQVTETTGRSSDEKPKTKTRKKKDVSKGGTGTQAKHD